MGRYLCAPAIDGRPIQGCRRHAPVDRPAPSGAGVGPESGSVLALVPAGFLVLILLAALAVDSAVAYLGRQQLQDALSAAANDAVAAGLNDASFYRHGALTLDPSAAARVVCTDLMAQADSTLRGVTVSMAVDGAAIRLVGSATVQAVFGAAIPGFARRAVSASAAASLESGPGTPAAARSPTVFGPPVPLRCP